MRSRWLGIDIGGTGTRLQLMEEGGVWSSFRKVPTTSWAQQPDALQALAQLIDETLEQQPVSGIMLGLPGILSRDRKQVISLPFIQALDHQPVAAHLAAQLGVPVAMDKDVNHLMLWDLLQLEQLPDNAVGLYPGTGMGNSLWLNGHFYHGEHGGAGELGHVPVAGNDLPCPCGNRGCAETLTSGHWLSHWAALNAADTPIAALFTCHGEQPELQAFVRRLAQLIATEMNILDPEYLILGGGVLAMADFPLALLRSQIQQHLRPPVTRENLKIVFSHSTDYTGCRGACLAAERLFRSAG
ncbi:allose kinase [Enterobacteriaceae bacterium EKM102V]|uniref:allose kinase n=1 Tax=Pantoea TaxID=53335 RepID=UPI00142DC5D4|nr:MULTISPECIES: allose kinase [Pantoea]KAF6661485.1 allose kinase [Enterobacteriaceae bacterium EKM102V]KAF6665505.1 allose kinase [Pantoea sp. EKM103V]